MSFNVDCYTMSSEHNVVDKQITTYGTYTGNIVEEKTDLTDPVITIEVSDTNIPFNYCYISIWSRYYYVTNKKILTTGLWEVSLHCDVLMSYKTLIRSQTAIIARQENQWNLYLNDGTFSTYQNSIVTITNFQSGFSGGSPQYILSIAGSYSYSSDEAEEVADGSVGQTDGQGE